MFLQLQYDLRTVRFLIQAWKYLIISLFVLLCICLLCIGICYCFSPTQSQILKIKSHLKKKFGRWLFPNHNFLKRYCRVTLCGISELLAGVSYWIREQIKVKRADQDTYEHTSQQLSIPNLTLLSSETHKWTLWEVHSGCRLMSRHIILLSFLNVKCLWWHGMSKQYLA